MNSGDGGIHTMWRQVQFAWEIVSERLSGDLDIFVPLDTGEERGTISVSLDAVDLTISHGKRYECTRISSKAPDSLKLSLIVWPRFQKLPVRGFYKKPFLLDEEMLDEMFHFMANDPDLAIAWLDDDIREKLSMAPCYGFVLHQEVLRAERNVLESDTTDLIAAVRAAAALASAGTLKYIPRWRELAEDIGGDLMIEGDRWRPGDQALITWEVNSRPIELIVSRSRLVSAIRGRSLCTQVRTPLVSPSLERYVISDRRVSGLSTIDVGEGAFFEKKKVWTSEPRASMKRFTDQLCRQIAALEPRYVESDGEMVSLGFRGFEMNPERLKTTGEIAATLAIPIPQAVYR